MRQPCRRIRKRPEHSRRRSGNQCANPSASSRMTGWQTWWDRCWRRHSRRWRRRRTTTLRRPMSSRNDEEKAELRRILEAPSEKELAAQRLAEIERQETEEREEAGKRAAVERSKGIARAIGSVNASLPEDEQ